MEKETSIEDYKNLGGGGVYFMDKAKQDIIECVSQLGKRAEELGYGPLAASLYVIAGSSYEGKESEEIVATVLRAYAASRVEQLRGESEDES